VYAIEQFVELAEVFNRKFFEFLTKKLQIIRMQIP